MRKLPTGLEVLGSVFSYFFPSDSRINLHTCTSNEKQLYLLKTPNSLQERLVSSPLVGGRPQSFFAINVSGSFTHVGDVTLSPMTEMMRDACAVS